MIAVVGAGPAGLAAAWRAARAGHEVVVLERAPVVGGMAGSFEVAGLRVDHGSHRLHPATPPHVLTALRELLGDDLQVRPRNGRIRLLGRWIAFPLRSTDLVRRMPPAFAVRVARDAMLAPLRRGRAGGDESFADVVRAGLGPAVLDTFYGPYARKLWGTEPHDLAAELAHRRITASSPRHIARRLLRRPGTAGRTFLYPRTGFGAIAEALADAAVTAGATIRLGCGVRSLRCTGATPSRGSTAAGHALDVAGSTVADSSLDVAGSIDRPAVGSSVPGGRLDREGDGRAGEAGATGPWTMELDDGSTLPAAHVWTTAPLPALASTVEPGPPHEVVAAAQRLRHRAMVLLYLVLEGPRPGGRGSRAGGGSAKSGEGPSWTEIDAHYFPGPEVMASRLSEPRNYRHNPDDPPDVTVLCAEIPCWEGDDIWQASDDELAGRLGDELAATGLPAVKPVQVASRRLPRVYPVYRPGFTADLAELEAWASGLPDLVTFGRQGLFTPDNTHHALAMGWSAADALHPDGTFDHAAWRTARDSFRSFVVED